MVKFRSIDFWKSSIMTLPDNAFFELLRTVFGKIKTPFSKQALMGDLEKFLLRKDIIKNIAGYIDDRDIRIIAAVAALDEPSPGELETFFSGDFSYAELTDLVINLEERFILYRFNKKGHNQNKSHIALNPLLEPVLSPCLDDTHVLFPSIAANDTITVKKTQEESRYLTDDRILAALLSFVSDNKLFFRMGGAVPPAKQLPLMRGIRQKVLNAAKLIFGDLPIDEVIGALQILGLFIAEDEFLIPDYRRFSAFGTLSRQERLIYCAAGIWCYNNSLDDTASRVIDIRTNDSRIVDAITASPWLFRSKTHNCANIISQLYNSLDPQRVYPHATLQKLAYMMQRENTGDFAAVALDNSIYEIMEKTGLITRVSPQVSARVVPENLPLVCWRKIPLPEFSSASGKNAAVAMDTSSTLLVYPEIAYNDVIALAMYSTVMEAGMTVRFEINRESAVMAFNRGQSANTIIELLRRLSHNRVDENLLYSLRDWEKRHGEVTLRRGLVLTLAPEQRHLAETKSLARLITETLAPGIYLLPESAEDKAADTLRRAGVSIIARRKESQGADGLYATGDSYSGYSRSFFQTLNSGFQKTDAGNQGKKNRNAAVSGAASVAALTDSFHSALNQMRHGKEERDELAARIDRRLVLCEAQLKDAVIRYEKLEARGLDYVGKAMIAKQAIAAQAPVELVWPGKKKQQERIFGIPRALEKSGTESILIVDPLDGSDTIRLSLGKISMLRRIKKSIFEV